MELIQVPPAAAPSVGRCQASHPNLLHGSQREELPLSHPALPVGAVPPHPTPCPKPLSTFLGAPLGAGAAPSSSRPFPSPSPAPGLAPWGCSSPWDLPGAPLAPFQQLQVSRKLRSRRVGAQRSEAAPGPSQGKRLLNAPFPVSWRKSCSSNTPRVPHSMAFHLNPPLTGCLPAWITPNVHQHHATVFQHHPSPSSVLAGGTFPLEKPQIPPIRGGIRSRASQLQLPPFGPSRWKTSSVLWLFGNGASQPLASHGNPWEPVGIPTWSCRRGLPGLGPLALGLSSPRPCPGARGWFGTGSPCGTSSGGGFSAGSLARGRFCPFPKPERVPARSTAEGVVEPPMDQPRGAWLHPKSSSQSSGWLKAGEGPRCFLKEGLWERAGWFGKLG